MKRYIGQRRLEDNSLERIYADEGGSGSVDLSDLENPIVLTPTGVAATDGPAMDAAVVTALADKRSIVLKAGTFKRTTTWDLKDAMSLRIRGAGESTTIIECTTDTAELMSLGGFGNHYSDFTIRHANFTPTGTTGNGIVFRKFAYSTLRRVQVYNAKNLFYIAQEDVVDLGTGGTTGNWMFSCTFENLILRNYFNSGIDLNSYNAASTGSVWNNIYLQNGAPGSARTSTAPPVNLDGVDEAVFNQLNIEDHAGTAIGILVNQSSAVFNSLHFERVKLSDWQPSFVRAYSDAEVVVNGMTLGYCDVQATGAGNYSSLCSAGAGGSLYVEGVYVHDCTKTLALPWRWVMAEDATTTGQVYMSAPRVKAGSPAFAAATTSTAANGIRQLGNTIYSPTLSTPALGTPASGTLTNCTGLPAAGVTTTVNAQTGTTYTLVLADANAVITHSNASASTITFPQNSSVAIPVGAGGEIHVLGAGQVTCAAGTGATVNGRGGALKSNGQYAVIGWRKVSTNGFTIFGDTTT